MQGDVDNVVFFDRVSTDVAELHALNVARVFHRSDTIMLVLQSLVLRGEQSCKR